MFQWWVYLILTEKFECYGIGSIDSPVLVNLPFLKHIQVISLLAMEAQLSTYTAKKTTESLYLIRKNSEIAKEQCIGYVSLEI